MNGQEAVPGGRQGLATAAILDFKTSTGTKEGYHSKLGYIVRYFKSIPEYQQYVDAEDKLILPLPFQAVHDLFGRISTDADLPKKTKAQRRAAIARIDEDDGDEDDDEDDPGASNVHTVSKSCLGGYKAALKNHYGTRKIAFTCPDLPSEQTTLDNWCDQYIKSYGNLIADKKQRGVMPVKEGKSEISFNGYEKLNKAFIDFKPKAFSGLSWLVGILCWCCSALQWNLICRSEVLDALHCPHMSWSNDNLVIKVCKHKKDRGGTGIGKDKRLKANPLNPILCPILAVGLYILSKDRNRESAGNSKFFDGADQRQRYSNILKMVLETFPDAVIELHFGCPREDLGTHSHRKGGITFLLGIIDGPNPCAVYIRAGWSMGNTQDRYIMGGPGEDELCGRILAGLKLEDVEEFAVLPPHFSQRGAQRLLEIGLDNFLDGYDFYETSFKHCVPYFIASILYHLPTLKEWFPTNHPVWGAKMFTANSAALLEELRGYVLLGTHTCPDTGLRATGVPLMLAQQKKIVDLENVVNTLKETVATSVQEILKQVTETSTNLAKSLPNDLEQMLTERFQIDGVMPLTRGDVQSIEASIMARLEAIVASLPSNIGNAGGAQEDGGAQQQLRGREGGREPFHWGGGFHMVPHDFEFPKASCKNMWFRWHLGQESHGIGPLKKLHVEYKMDIPLRHRYLVEKTHRVMEEISKYMAVEETLTKENCGDIFDRCFPQLVKRLYGEVKFAKPRFRWMDLSYVTLYNMMGKENKRRREEDEEDEEAAEGLAGMAAGGGEEDDE